MEYIAKQVKALHPDVPIMFFTKGGSNSYGEYAESVCDGIGVDWSVTMGQARARIGNGKVLQGNFDPAFLYGDAASIRENCQRAYAVYR